MTEAVADTSVFLALEAGRPMRPFEGRLRVSVATITELEIGVLMAGDPASRRVRAGTLGEARALVPPVYTQDRDFIALRDHAGGPDVLPAWM